MHAEVLRKRASHKDEAEEACEHWKSGVVKAAKACKQEIALLDADAEVSDGEGGKVLVSVVRERPERVSSLLNPCLPACQFTGVWLLLKKGHG